MFVSLLLNIWKQDDGQDIAEYALMLTVILLVVAATVMTIGDNANTIFKSVAGQLTAN